MSEDAKGGMMGFAEGFALGMIATILLVGVCILVMVMTPEREKADDE